MANVCFVMESAKLIALLQHAVSNLLLNGPDAGPIQSWRPTQREALKAYLAHLEDSSLPIERRLKAAIEIPTGIGKTVLFSALTRELHMLALREGIAVKTLVVEPTLQLMMQTKNAFSSAAKDISPGLYGGGSKDLENEVIIATYPAYADLAESGTLSDRNVDLKISDEAHRGTSERRIDLAQMFKASAMIGVTATAHFDDEKSIEKSHGGLIYSKSLPDAVRGGELAAYIHLQTYLIRVSPATDVLPEVIGEEDNIKQLEVKRARHGIAWMQRVVEIFASGQDKFSGDPLTDNQAAFFTADTAQADALASRLNAHPYLKSIAAAKGCKGVAAAVHTIGMSEKRQAQNLEDFTSGRYLAIVGDEKLKEGFDHAPLKVIFDYPRGSLVDKAQILGRGVRQWWNPSKNRFEGMTMIDTVI